jgi:hypothetical protein
MKQTTHASQFQLGLVPQSPQPAKSPMCARIAASSITVRDSCSVRKACRMHSWAIP